MKRFLISVGLMLAFASPSFAQFTTVTATVTDPNGIPYAGAVMNAVLVPGASGGYTLSGAPYSGRIGPVTLDSTGKFTVNFGDVTLITPGSPQWQITIDSAAATIPLSLGTGPQSFSFTSTGTTISGGSVVNLSSSLNALAPKLTNFAGAGTGTIAGAVTASHIPYASGANTVADIVGSAVTGGTGAITLTAGADTTTPVAIASHSTTQSATELDISNQSTGTPAMPLTVRGRGTGAFTPAANKALVNIEEESAATAPDALVITNRQANIAAGAVDSGFVFSVTDAGLGQFFGGGAAGDANKNYSGFVWDTLSGITLQQPNPTGAGANAARVSLSIQQSTGQTGDILDLKNSSGTVLDSFANSGSLGIGSSAPTACGSATGCIALTEASTAGTPTAGQDYIRADSGHQILVSVNGAAEVPEAHFSATPTGSKCLQSSGTLGVIAETAGACGGGTIAIPATVSGATSGGIPCFDSTTDMNTSVALTSHVIVQGGGAAACPGIGNGDFTIDSTAHTFKAGAAGLVDLSAEAVNGFIPPKTSGAGATTLGALNVSTQFAPVAVQVGTGAATAWLAYAGSPGSGSTICGNRNYLTSVSAVTGPNCGLVLSQFVTGSDYTNATTSPTNVTGLAIPLAASTNYAISCHLIYQASATTASMILTSTGPASPTKVTASTIMDTTAGAGAAFYSAATDGATFGFTVGPTAVVTTATDMLADLHVGVINGSNAGTFQLQANANGTGTITIKVGSFCTVQ